MPHAFAVALNAFERDDQAPSPPVVVAARLPLPATAAPPLAVAPGGHSLWESAAIWTPEADPPPPRPTPPSPPPSADPSDIAATLRISELKSAGDVTRARRRFMWENHPDRLHSVDRSLSNRRVAIANMLLDQRLKSLTKPRR